MCLFHYQTLLKASCKYVIKYYWRVPSKMRPIHTYGCGSQRSVFTFCIGIWFGSISLNYKNRQGTRKVVINFFFNLKNVSVVTALYFYCRPKQLALLAWNCMGRFDFSFGWNGILMSKERPIIFYIYRTTSEIWLGLKTCRCWLRDLVTQFIAP